MGSLFLVDFSLAVDRKVVSVLFWRQGVGPFHDQRLPFEELLPLVRILHAVDISVQLQDMA